MTDFSGLKIGYAVTGSFCTFEKSFKQAEILRKMGAEIIPIMSENASSISTRFGSAEDNLKKFENICDCKVITTIADAETDRP